MRKTNERKLNFMLKAGCVNQGGHSEIKVAVVGEITPADKLMIIAQAFDAMVEIDTKEDRTMIAGILYGAAQEGLPAVKYLKDILRMID